MGFGVLGFWGFGVSRSATWRERQREVWVRIRVRPRRELGVKLPVWVRVRVGV